jgi:hypothetical protein
MTTATSTAPDAAAATPTPRLTIGEKYRRDHQNPINHVLHVYVGWPLCALGVISLPFHPICFVYGFAAGYACMWTGHFVFERNLPTVFRHPTTPFVMAWSVMRAMGQGAWRLVRGR